MFNLIVSSMKHGAVFAIMTVPQLCNNRTFIYVKSSITKDVFIMAIRKTADSHPHNSYIKDTYEVKYLRSRKRMTPRILLACKTLNYKGDL